MGADQLYNKFDVRRTDGRDQPGGDKEGARYFVLDYVNDPRARVALAAYADVVADDEPGLAADLRGLVADVVVLGRRCIAGHEAIEALLRRIAQRGADEARDGAGGGRVAFVVAVEGRHLVRRHVGPAMDCTTCKFDVAAELAAATEWGSDD
ncbi:hypothetical protein [Micromonospora sp. NPDC047730]|uniref:hypothetical protein n=1 Tax=Micromonospora sp. NPDC047730 TaxID=3364253 RepID=UPI003721DBBF